MLLHADDIKLFRKVDSREECALLQSDICSLSTWCLVNKLLINPTKTHVMSLTRKCTSVLYDYMLDQCILKMVDGCPDFGIFFDSALRFHVHIEKVVKKAYSQSGVISSTRCPFRNVSCLKHFVFIRRHSETSFWVYPMEQLVCKPSCEYWRCSTTFCLNCLWKAFW